MLGWLSAIASLAGTVASGIGSAIANREEKEEIERERGEMNHWYNQRIYEDPTKRADNAAMMNQLKMTLRKKEDIENNKRKVLGGTQEGALAMQQQNANAVANVSEQLMADQAKRVDTLEGEQRKEQLAYDRQQAELRARQAKTWGNLAGNAANTFGGFDKGDVGGGTTGLNPHEQEVKATDALNNTSGQLDKTMRFLKEKDAAFRESGRV